MFCKAITVLAAPSKRSLECFNSGGSQVSYSTLGNDIASFCAKFGGHVHGNQAPASANVNGVHFEMGWGCGGNSGPLAAADCRAILAPIANSCGPADGTTHGGEVVSGCWTGTAFVN